MESRALSGKMGGVHHHARELRPVTGDYDDDLGGRFDSRDRWVALLPRLTINHPIQSTHEFL
jgi:hypothetical protein